MTHTLPDYTTKYKMAQIFGQIDSGELAARLGAASTQDRRGALVWFDDFEAAAAVKWQYNFSVGGSVALSAERAWMGNQSMKTVTPAGIGDAALMDKKFSLPIERQIGIEVMTCMTTGNPIIELDLIGYDGSYEWATKLKYNYNRGKLYYFNSTGDWTELTVYDSTLIVNEHWIFMKLVINWDAKEYVRIMFGSTTYSLKNIPIWSLANAGKEYIQVTLYNTAATAAVSTVYFDNFILTQNEP